VYYFLFDFGGNFFVGSVNNGSAYWRRAEVLQQGHKKHKKHQPQHRLLPLLLFPFLFFQLLLFPHQY
jgi:hypothetical protein